MPRGGFIGYMKKGSITSFAGGASTGLLLILAGFISLKAFEKKKNLFIAMVLQTGTGFPSLRGLRGQSVRYLRDVSRWSNDKDAEMLRLRGSHLTSGTRK